MTFREREVTCPCLMHEGDELVQGGTVVSVDQWTESMYRVEIRHASGRIERHTWARYQDVHIFRRASA